LPFLLAAAQAAGQKQTESALGTVLEYGLLGAICVLLIVSLVYSIRGWLREKDNRREDLSQMATARENDNKALQALTIEMKEFAAQQQVEATRTQDGVKNTLEGQKDDLNDLKRAAEQETAKFGEMRTAVDMLKDEQVRLGAAILQRGSS